MKVILMTPPYHCGMIESAGVWLPLGLVYIAGELKKIPGLEVIIYDAMSLYHTYEDIARFLEEERPDIIGISAITASFYSALEVCRIAKELSENTFTVLGNVHPTFMYEEALKHKEVDVVVIGEGEITFRELVEALINKEDLSKVKGIAYRKEGQIVKTPDRDFLVNLDELTPAWDLVDWKIYTYFPKENSRLAIVSSSRGCFSECAFCSQRLFWKGSWRARSPENFVNELELLAKKYGVNVVMLSDELPNRDKNRWEKILDLLIERDLGMELLIETRADHIVRDEDILEKYKKAGVTHIYVGVESASPEVLKEYNKNLEVEISLKALRLINQLDIVSETSFVVGLPEETKESLKNTFEMALIYDPDMCFFIPLTPWPYTPIYEKYRDFIQHEDWSQYNLVDPVIKPKGWNSLKEFKLDLIEYTSRFFLYKFENLHKLTPFKRKFMIDLINLLIKNSYLRERFKEKFSKILLQKSLKKILKLIPWQNKS